MRPENRARYPKNWREISRWIRFDRAKGRCECRGECGRPHVESPDGRCLAVDGAPIRRLRDLRVARPLVELGPARRTRKPRGIVRLTVAHRDHTPEHNDPENLAAWCEWCHLGHDRQHHLASRHHNRARKLRKAGQTEWPFARQLTIVAGDGKRRR